MDGVSDVMQSVGDLTLLKIFWFGIEGAEILDDTLAKKRGRHGLREGDQEFGVV